MNKSSVEKIIVTNPSQNYQILATHEQTSLEAVDEKVYAARKAFASWSQVSLHEKVKFITKLLHEIERHKDELALLISQEMGMPVTICHQIDIDPGIDFIKGYCRSVDTWLQPKVIEQKDNQVHTLYYEPLGIVAAIVPWNYPFSNFVWAVLPQLLVGNTVVLKHSEYSMLVTKKSEKIFANVGLSDVCQFVYGTGENIGNYLIHSPVDMLWFIGSTQTGNIIHQVAAQQGIPALLELGGSAPGIVFDDVDIDEVVKSVFYYRFINSGQTCDGLKRLIVHENIYEDFIAKLVDYTGKQVVGSALDKNSVIGPVVNKRQLETVIYQVQDVVDKGAQVRLGGSILESLLGAYYQPTILTNISLDMVVWNEEVFGPVLPVVSFASTDEAIDLANDTEFGLGAYLYTTNQAQAKKVARHLRTGNISINGANYVIPSVPFGGYTKSSGIGRVHCAHGLRQLCNIKVVSDIK